MKRSSPSVTGRIGGTGMFFLVVSLLAAAVLLTGCPTPTNSDSGGSGGSGGDGGDGGTSWDGQYQLGDPGPAGGLIFYIDVEDDHPDWTYLESAPSGWSTTAEGLGLQWLTERTDVNAPGGFESSAAIGTGKENTEAILALPNGDYPAAQAAENYSVTNGGTTYDDWFLPSPHELNEMYKTLHAQSQGGFSTTHNTSNPPSANEVMYWSSYADDGSLFSVNFVLPESTRGDNFSQWTIGWLGEQNFYVRPARRF